MDLIDRQAAIDALKPCAGVGNRVLDKLRALPSAEPKTGEWTSHSVGHEHIPWGFDCSNCGKWFVIGKDSIEEYNYCPNCGAKMEGEADEH